ncbi:MAG: hypothetical protein LW850_21785 [Planctomycetaceae bacterium]|jgi:hypothetical protein|nr:hypothetical protein [Planctomycetaceae bacterium]MCE2813027.1 hypothetical protein [Planctomycetaceae bacterium]
MQSIVAALSWEYYARNRWMLLFFPLLANIPALCMLLPLKSISPDASFMSSPLLIGIQVTLILSIVLMVCFGVLTTQGGLKRFYRLPISTLQITSYYFWSGAVIVGAQIALVLWLWRILLPIDWPIAAPVLFSVVCWCALQPLVRGQSQSLWWIVLAILIVIALFLWLLMSHGIPLQQGGMLASQIHYWTVISRTDWLITFGSLGLAYWLTVLRVTYDRSGRGKMSLLEKIELAWEAIESRWFRGSRKFRSPIQAYSWSDFRRRLIAIPTLVVVSVIVTWLIAILVSILQQDISPLLKIAFGGTYLASGLQVYIAFLFGFLNLFGRSLARFEAPDLQQKISGSFDFDFGPFKDHLPISAKDKASALRRSSWIATLISSAVVILSYLIIAALGGGSGDGTDIKSWKYICFMLGSAMLLTFVFSNLKLSIAPALCRVDLWIWPLSILAILLAFRLPLGLCVSATFGVLVLVALVSSTIESQLKNDLSRGIAAGVWVLGASIAVATCYMFGNELGSVGMLLVASLVGLSMLPFFSTASGIRNARTN